ncbi:SnoaL-domain-containing protein [Xylariaceae sp. FL0594]|nr:SnoaL-domain-containing protein [Xylariaceae sp. FL0594]
MPSVEGLYRSFIQCINDQQWDEGLAHPSATLNHNGREMPITEDAIKELGKASGASVIQLTVDAVTVDEQSQSLGAIVRVRVQQPDNTGKAIASQHLVWTEDGRISKMATMLDLDELLQRRRQLSDPGHHRPAAAALLDSSSSSSDHHHGIADSGELRLKLSRRELEETYRAYIGCINAHEGLSRFCHDAVTHNGKTYYPLDEYRALMEDAFAAVPDLVFAIDDDDGVVVDEAAQRVAVRIEFTGTPTGVLAGVEPTGRSVRFYEYVTYQFQDGKIDTVWR